MCVCVSTAPHVEFTKPLQDVEVKEKESAKFECEVSRESAKVRAADIHTNTDTDLKLSPVNQLRHEYRFISLRVDSDVIM